MMIGFRDDVQLSVNRLHILLFWKQIVLWLIVYFEYDFKKTIFELARLLNYSFIK